MVYAGQAQIVLNVEQRTACWTSIAGVTWMTECCIMDRVWCTEFYMVYRVLNGRQCRMVANHSWNYMANRWTECDVQRLIWFTVCSVVDSGL